MSIVSRAAKESITKRSCFVCGLPVKEAEGCYQADLGILTHGSSREERLCSRPPDENKCSVQVDALRRDYSESKRGKWRRRGAVLADLLAERFSASASLGRRV